MVKYASEIGREGVIMNVSGISGGATGAEMISMRAMASAQVLDMAQNAFEDAAAELIDMMSSAITGLGNSIDMTV